MGEREQLREEREQFLTAMQSRGPIEQAKGMLMYLLGCDPDEAFGVLTKLSQRTGAKLARVADLVVRELRTSEPVRLAATEALGATRALSERLVS